MSFCPQCQSPIVPGAQVCHTCGYNMAPIVAAAVAPLGTRRAVIGTSPTQQVISGVGMLMIGLVAAAANPFFYPIALIIIIMGTIVLAMGLMGKSIPQEQITFEGNYGSGDQSYAPRPVLMKRCSSCGAEIPMNALACSFCGNAQKD